MDIEHSEVYKRYLELSKPTEEDFKRVFSEDELKELCLRHKCRVNMWRWNVVNDYRVEFTKSGRFQRWSETDRLGMLAKAVNRMKPRVLYDDKEIKKTRREEWEFQLKDNILSLNLWQRQQFRVEDQLEESNISGLVFSDSEDIEPGVDFAVNTESMNVDVLLSQPATTITQPLFEVHVSSQSVNADEVLTEPNQLQGNINKQNGVPCILDNFDDGSVDTVLNKDFQQSEFVVIQSEEVAPEIAKMYNVNTISLSIDSQITQSEGLAVLQSQDVIPASYDNFETLIPLTSTQSNKERSEDIILSQTVI